MRAPLGARHKGLGESARNARRYLRAGLRAQSETLKYLAIDWRLLVGAAALVVVAAAVMIHRVLKKPEDPEDEERRRRFQLNQVGRIVEGLVVELVETPASPAPGFRLFTPQNRSSVAR